MAGEVRFTIEGAEDIQRALLAMPTEYQKRAMVDAFMAGAEIVAQEARLEAMAQGIDVFDDPQEEYRDSKRKLFRKGQFYENIVAVKTSSRGKRYVGQDSVVQVAVKKGFSSVAHFFEFGTGPRHREKGGSTGHMEARPFLRPALDSAGKKAIDAIAARTKLNIETIFNQRMAGKKVSLRRPK